MIQPPELQARINIWRDKQAKGTMTDEDWMQCISDLRDHRQGAAKASKARKAAKGPIDTGALKNLLLGGLKKS